MTTKEANKRRTSDALPGIGAAVGAGCGLVIGVALAGAPGIALGLVAGSAVGVIIGAAARMNARPSRRG